ncbi:MAG: hypothetical protein OEZ25_06845 [Candidatus Bathyarchaeota archaeon]|nr:hypothetical protein [Candidatus Bathyarchaeota archaeon]
MPKDTKTYAVVTTAVLSTLSIIFEVIPSFRIPWGMKIDFVGVVWVLAYFLYGLKEALGVSVITTLFILGYSPTTFVGATMKFIATLPMFLIPVGLMHSPFFSEKTSRSFNRLPVMVMMCVLATSVRLIVTSVVNLYWAIPLFWGITSDAVLEVFGGVVPFVVFVASMNLLQSIVDVVVPWILAYKFKLAEYLGTW